MENNSHLMLSDYQCAILNEMGISLWQIANEQQKPSKADNQTHVSEATFPKASSKVVSKVEALDKLKQLKAQTQTDVITDSILVALLPSEADFRIFNDVLIALSLETKQQQHISIEQLTQFSGYPLSWAQGDKVSLNHKQLITPALVELQSPDIKKLLWQQLQSALSLAKIN